MGKIRLGGYIFITWIGDHSPRHVHVFRDGRLIVKWDLEDERPLVGEPTARILRLIGDLQAQGRL